MTDQELSRLKRASTALKNNDPNKARELILQEIRKDPSNLSAWIWALEVAKNEAEKRTILKKILELDPNHQGALRYLQKIDQGIQTDQNNNTSLPFESREQEEGSEVSRIGGLLRFFADGISSLSPTCGLLFLVVTVLGVIFIYLRVNSSFFGLARADIDNLVITNSYESIADEDLYWEVQFEGIGSTKYTGIIRHIAPIRIGEFRILTHDILVTTADFSNPEIVETRVVDHKFFWQSANTSSPNGSINLIHAVPANNEIYQEMLQIDTWDNVMISGREIFSIKAYQADETFLGTWIDAGCNTLLVESVTKLESADK